MSTISRQDPDALRRALAAIQDLRRRLEAAEREGSREPIAIVGAGCRLPGADSPEAFWDLLDRGESAIGEVPAQRWNVEEYFHPDPEHPGTAYTRAGAFADDVDRFDARFFEISPREARTMDPQHRVLLETSWAALEHAAIDPVSLRGRPVGVFVGMAAPPEYAFAMLGSPSAVGNPYAASGSAVSIAAGRLAYFFGAHGPALTLDTACSSSLVAIHLAMQSLRRGECDLALGAGVSAMLEPMVTALLCQARMLSPTGRCHTFDAAADGYVRGEGCGVFVLKRLADAQAASDRILAVLRGSAVNQDGRSSGLTAPNGTAQEALVRAALRDADLGPGDVSYIEAHGTGTKLGDPIEVHALRAVFERDRPGDRPLLLGSVKTNIGHLEAAAGVSGVLKVIGALQRERIPPHLNFRTPNPAIDWGTGAIQVTAQPVAWPRSDKRRVAGVSSFGFSGTNAHVLLEEAPPAPARTDAERGRSLLTLSARTPTALSALASRLEGHLATHDVRLDDVCYSMATGRALLEHRAAMVVGSIDEARVRLRELAAGDTTRVATRAGSPAGRARVAFLYTGQGAQYPGMGRQLFESAPVFREALLECDAELEPIEGRRLLEWLFDDGPDAATRINQTLYAQPALFCLEIALTRLWTSWGIEPVAVVGHSVGEVAAACAAGAMSLADGLRLIAARARLMQSLPAGGGMLAVRAPLDAVAADMAPHGDRISVAAVNAADDVVLSGTGAVLDDLASAFRARGLAVTPLRVSHAFHSPLMAPIVDAFRDAISSLTIRAPRWRLISNLTGQPLGDVPLDADYWCRHLLQPVMFGASIATLRTLKIDAFLEIGPHPVLTGMASRGQADDASVWLTSLRRGRDDWQSMLTAVGELYLSGITCDAKAVARPAVPRRIALPTYPFERQRYRLERAPATRVAADRPIVMRSASSGEVIVQDEVSVETSPWLEQHRVYGAPCYPAAGYLSLALQAWEAAEGTAAEVRGLAIEQPLVFEPGQTRAVQVALAPEGAGSYRCAIFASPDERAAGWQRIASCRLAVPGPHGAPGVAPEAAGARHGEAIDVAKIYAEIAMAGIDYGPAFRPIRTLATRGLDIVATMDVPLAGARVLQPALFDAAIFQVVGAAWLAAAGAARDADAFLPVGVERLNATTIDTPGTLTCFARLRQEPQQTDATIVADLAAWDDAGRRVIDAVGVTARRAPRDAIRDAIRGSSDLLYELAWRPAAVVPPGSLAGTTWLFLTDAGGVAASLAGAVERNGGVARCVSRVELADRGRAAEPGALRALLESAGSRLTGVVDLSPIDPAGADEEVAPRAHDLAASVLDLVQTAADFADSGTPVRLVVVTRGAAGPLLDRPDGLAGGPIWGLLRVARSERPDLDLQVVDLEPGQAVSDLTALLLPHLSAADTDWQSVYRAGVRHVPRLARRSHDPQVRLEVPDGPYQLTIDAPGVIDHLQLSPLSIEPPGPGDVQIEVSASGLNFRDVLNALGMYPGGGPLGSEVAGRVVAVGPGVTRAAVGDRVMAVTSRAFCASVNTHELFVRRIPDTCSDEEAATMPAACLTVEYALRVIGGLAAGERVLIHAAAGGVGMAAVRFAREVGAEIFATAGSESKRRLLREMGVPHVMDSRTLDFADEIRRVTYGEGVDVVLNSLTGEAIDRGFGVLRAGGRFLEIGKAEWRDPDKVHRAWPGIRYLIVDLTQVIREEPEVIGTMLDRIGDALEAGRLAPLPCRVFGIDQARDAFRFMAQARHVGKVVVAHRPPAGRCRPDGTYVVTGGAGALGLEIARWLAGRGARHLVLVGRSRPSASATETMADLASQGVDVRFVPLDVASLEQVETLVRSIPANQPLRGVIHAAGVLDDGMLTDMTGSRLAPVMRPKVDGAWNLHVATRGRTLDLFVLFASVAGVLGSAAQGNYAAGNVFLDVLARHRRDSGLAALAMDWGPWAASGMAACLDDRDRARLDATGIRPLPAERAMKALEEALLQEHAQVVTIDVDWPVVARSLSTVGVPRVLEDLVRSSGAAGSGSSRKVERTRLELTQVPPAERPACLLGHVREQLRAVLALDADAPIHDDDSFVELGMDSLTSVELRNRLQNGLGMQIPVTAVLEYPTLARLTAHILETQFDAGAGQQVESTNADRETLEL